MVPMVRFAGPLAMTCALVLALASGCGGDDNAVSASASTGSSTTTESECPRVAVVVVAQDIPAGTKGAEAAANGWLREDEISAFYRPATAVTSLDQVAEGVAIGDLEANQVVTYEQFGLQTDTTLTSAGASCGTEGSTTTAEG